MANAVKINAPMTPDKMEATNTENLASESSNVWPVNERTEINIDMVNPMPAKKPTPIICIQAALSGKLDIFSLTAIQEMTAIRRSR